MKAGAKKNFTTRTLSGIIILAIVLSAILLSQYTFALLLAVICTGSLWEFYGLAEGKGLQPMKWMGIFMSLLILLLATSLSIANFPYREHITIPALLLIFLLFFITIAAEIYRNKENPIGNSGATLLGIIYIVIPICLLLFIPILTSITQSSVAESSLPIYQPWVVLWYIFIIWMNDIGAYLVGVNFGKNRLFERISPNKSWEGFFGGLVFGIGTGILAAVIMDWDIWFWTGLGVVVVVTGVFGDLIESMFKRSAGVKDSGNLIPGHGGMLDRFDALIFSAPFVFIYFYIFAT